MVRMNPKRRMEVTCQRCVWRGWTLAGIAVQWRGAEGGKKGLVCALKFNGTEGGHKGRPLCQPHSYLKTQTPSHQRTQPQRHENAATDITCKHFIFIFRKQTAWKKKGGILCIWTQLSQKKRRRVKKCFQMIGMEHAFMPTEAQQYSGHSNAVHASTVLYIILGNVVIRSQVTSYKL